MVASPAMDETLAVTYGGRAGVDDFCQLRHQTKNALQRIIIQVLEAPALCGTREGRRAADEIVQRIELSAAISDALFGLTKKPPMLAERLNSLAATLIAFHADEAQTIELEVTVEPGIMISLPRENAIIRIVHELVVNALKHGLHMRLIGKLSIFLDRQEDGRLLLTVCNDGWKIDRHVSRNCGLGIVEELVHAEGGDMRIFARPDTTFQIGFPPEDRNHSRPGNQINP